MKNLLCKTDCVGKGMHIDKALLVIRLAAGIIFVLHGYGKLTGNPSLEMFSGMVGNLGFPMPMFFAWIVALTETLGGLALILGIFVRPAGVLLSIVMLVALGMVKKFALPAADVDLALLGISIALAIAGPGHLSLAHKMMGKDCCQDEECCGGHEGHDHKH
jgi:putative oxidoreductase